MEDKLMPQMCFSKKASFSDVMGSIFSELTCALDVREVFLGREHPTQWQGVKIILIDTSMAHGALDYFFSVWMPKIRSPFIMITYGDKSVPNFALSHRSLSRLATRLSHRRYELSDMMNNPYLVAWYVMNFDYSLSHPKIRPYPIGRLDENNLMKRFLDESKKTSSREFMVYSDTGRGKGEEKLRTNNKKYHIMRRPDVHRKIKNNPFIKLQKGNMEKTLQWKERTKYMFSLSLVGKGFDCYRTWESLYLGNIVLLQSSPSDHLFEGLPVVIIKDWSEINEANLKKWAAQYHDASTNPKYREKLTSAYWLKMLEADIEAGEKKFNTYRASYAKSLPS